MSNVAPYAKAIIGAVVAALSMLAGFLINDTALGDITAGQWVAIAIAFLSGLIAVFAVPNSEQPS